VNKKKNFIIEEDIFDTIHEEL